MAAHHRHHDDLIHPGKVPLSEPLADSAAADPTADKPSPAPPACAGPSDGPPFIVWRGAREELEEGDAYLCVAHVMCPLFCNSSILRRRRHTWQPTRPHRRLRRSACLVVGAATRPPRPVICGLFSRFRPFGLSFFRVSQTRDRDLRNEEHLGLTPSILRAGSFLVAISICCQAGICKHQPSASKSRGRRRWAQPICGHDSVSQSTRGGRPSPPP